MASALHVGAATSNLTPKLGTHMAGYFSDRLADDVHDELHSKAIVVQNDDTALAIVVLDLIVALQEDLAVAKQRASDLTGIPVESIFISCTHTHTGAATTGLLGAPRDEPYMSWAMEKAGDAVKLAYNRLRPARMGHASGSCPEETHNRRWHMQDGTVKMNPGYQNPDLVRPAGPTDPEVAVAVFIDADSSPIAALTNYSLHYVGGGSGTAISADYFAAFSQALQRMAGSDFVAIMANGCCGDINNCDFAKPAPEHSHPYYQLQRVADVVASRAYGAWQQIRDFRSEAILGAATEMMDFTRRQSTAEELQQARRILASPGDHEVREQVYANELLEVDKEPLVRPIPIMGLRIGDLGIVGLPGEIFVEYGLQIKHRSPFARTMTVELANDYIGYCPTDLALIEGSYETRLARSAKAAAGTEQQMLDTAVAVLNQLSGSH